MNRPLWFALLSFMLCSSTFANAAPLDTFRDCDVCPEMIELPLGEFVMGAPEGEAQQDYHWYNNGLRPTTPEHPFIAYEEGPLHRVEIDIPFAMARKEVTYNDWMTCVSDGGCDGYVPDTTVRVVTAGGEIVRLQATDTRPAIRISYIDALTYVAWLNEKVGVQVYRLPTEAEWEYAARAGTQTAFAQGDDVTPEQVNYSDQARARLLAGDDPDYIIYSFPVPVEDLDAANAWGLRHMSGNISERTMSCWSERQQSWPLSSEYLEKARLVDTCYRVRRGGDHSYQKNFSRLGARGQGQFDVRLPHFGFRVVREISHLTN